MGLEGWTHNVDDFLRHFEQWIAAYSIPCRSVLASCFMLVVAGSCDDDSLGDAGDHRRLGECLCCARPTHYLACFRECSGLWLLSCVLIIDMLLTCCVVECSVPVIIYVACSSE